MRIRHIPTKILTNPLYMYGISFLVVLFVFMLRWSTFYDTIEDNLLIFIIATSLLSAIIGTLPVFNKCNVFRPIPISPNNKLMWRIIVLGYIVDFIYCRNVPFISIVLFGIGGYRDFEGIPMFHFLLSNISIFWGIYVFLQYQSNPKSHKLKRYVLLSYLPHILLLNRGSMIQLLFSSIFIWLMRINKMSIKRVLFFCVGVFGFLMVFGVIGNARQDISQEDNTYILRIGGAKEEFIESDIPKVLFWAYMYIASPLGNVQNAISYADPYISYDNFISMCIESCCPDFVSKRLAQIRPPTYKYDFEDYLVSSTFNAPAVFFQPYVRMGWFGMFWMFGFMVIVVFSYMYLVSTKSVFFLVGWSGLLTTITLNTFNNMWYFGGLSLLSINILVNLYWQIKNKKQKTCNEKK